MYRACLGLCFKKSIRVDVVSMHVNLQRRYPRRRQTSLLIKLRAKMVTIVYKADILMVFLFVMVTGMVVHYILWIYEPPDLINYTKIAYSEQQALLREWKRKKLQDSQGLYDGLNDDIALDSHFDDFAPGFEHGAVQGPNSRRNKDIFGDILSYEDSTKLSHKSMSSLLLAKRKSELANKNKEDIALLKQEHKQIFDTIQEKLLNEKSLQTSKESILRNISQSVMRKRLSDIENDKLTKTNKTSSDADLHQIFAENRVLNSDKMNETAMDKLIETINKDSSHVLEMQPSEREYWLDNQAESLYKLMFHKDPKAIKHQDRALNISAPIGGKLKGGRAQCVIYDVSADINETFDCMEMNIKPPVSICLYPSDIDIHISRAIRQSGIWEPFSVKEFQNILFTNPDYGFIDIGANIGAYSLIAARMGHSVVAVEPFITNIKHLHQAVKIGGLQSKITLLRNAISDQRLNYMSLKLDKHNQGGIRLDPGRKDPCLARDCVDTVKAIYMDDLLEVINFKKGVMKIDIEGFEPRAFIHSAQLFDQVYISSIIMEWIIVRGYYGTEVDDSDDKRRAQNLVDMLFNRGFRPFSLITGVELKQRYWYAWPDDIIWKNDLDAFN